MKGEQPLELGYRSVSVETAGSGLCIPITVLPLCSLHTHVINCVWVHLFSKDVSSLFLSGTELYVIMSLSKDYISWRWFLHGENYASLNWSVFRKLLCTCFLTRNAEGDLFASLIGQHLLGLEAKAFHIFSLSYPAFLWGPLSPPLPTLPVLQAPFLHAWVEAVRHSMLCASGAVKISNNTTCFLSIFRFFYFYRKLLPLLPLNRRWWWWGLPILSVRKESLKYFCNAAALSSLWPFSKTFLLLLSRFKLFCVT